MIPPRHRLALEMILFEGLTQREVARRLQYSEPHLSQIVNSPGFQHALKHEMETKSDATRTVQLRKLTDRCLDVCEEILRTGEVAFAGPDGKRRVIRITGRTLMKTVSEILNRTLPKADLHSPEPSSNLGDLVIARFAADRDRRESIEIHSDSSGQDDRELSSDL